MITIDYFIPLIGSFYIAVDNLIKNGYKLQHNKIFSYNNFSKNEEHFINNYSVDIEYINKDNYNKNAKAELLCCIPPCGGLSQLNSNINDNHFENNNKFIINCINFFKNNDYKMLILENAPGLTGKFGLSLLNILYNLLDKNYKMHIIKTNTMHHGLPQSRKRCFLLIYKMEISHISNFIISNGNLYAAGANSSGQLGIDPQLNGDKIHTYMKVPVNAIITSISNNSDNTAAIDIDGNLWVCGSNYYGQLGLGDTNPRKAFTLVPFNSKIMSVSCGYTHIAVIDEEGNLWVCGGVDTMGYNDNHGQLRLYDIGGVLAFTQVPSNVRFRTVT